jgi:toxin HigB-1
MTYLFNATRDEAGKAIGISGSGAIDRVTESTQPGILIPTNTELYNPAAWLKTGYSPSEIILSTAIIDLLTYQLTILSDEDTMIISFTCKETELIFNGNVSKKLPGDIQRTALRKLLIIEAAISIEDLRIPPGNRLEKLVGDRDGQYSIRINDQWRICFNWTDEGNAQDIEIVDYH